MQSSTFFNAIIMKNRKINIEFSIDFSGLWEIAIFITLIFAIFRVTNLIAWSVWWILSPLWIAGGIQLLVTLVVIIFYRH